MHTLSVFAFLLLPCPCFSRLLAPPPLPFGRSAQRTGKGPRPFSSALSVAAAAAALRYAFLFPFSLSLPWLSNR